MTRLNPRTAVAATLAAGALAVSALPAQAATEYGEAPSYQDFRASTVTGSRSAVTMRLGIVAL